MKNLRILFMATAIIAFISCKNEKKELNNEVNDSIQQTDNNTINEEEATTITVAMESKSGSTAKGNVLFSEENGSVSMKAVITGLKSGTHAIHIHEKADCSSDDGKSTGGHWNPTHQKHGKWGDAEGYHKGDIGNFEVGDDGVGTVTMETDEWCIGCGDENKDLLGKAVIVHDGKDDFTTQPTGDAGGRVSCGGIIRQY